MIYHSKINPIRRRILVTLLCLAVVIGAVRFVFPGEWAYLVVGASRPFARIGKGFTVLTAKVEDALPHSQKEVEENNALSHKIDDLSLALTDRNTLETENEALKSMLGRNDSRTGTLAVVLSKPTITPYDTFTIDIGSDNGILPNQEVLAGSSTAIGVVTEVYPTFSKVTAYSSPNSRHQVSIGSTNIQAEATGQGNGNYEIVLPEGSNVNVGDAIVIPNIIPTIFGTVEKIVPSDQPSFINILFKAPVNLNELYYVQVIK